MKVAAAVAAAVSICSSAGAIDPTMLQTVAAHVRDLDLATGQHVTRWMVDPGQKACLLRDGDDTANSRIIFIRETGKISMWVTPHASDLAAKISAAQAYQLYFVPLGQDASSAAVNEFGAALWQEPLAKAGLPGMAIEADPGQMLEKYPAGFAVVLAQGDRMLFADIVRPDIAALLPELKKCRGGR